MDRGELICLVASVFFGYVYLLYPLCIIVFGYLLPRHQTKKDLIDDLPRVTVVIPVRNRQESIRATVDGVMASDYPTSHLSIVVADNGSTDATIRRAQDIGQKSGQVKWLRYAVQSPRGEILKDAARLFPQNNVVIMLDPSVTPEGNTIRRLASGFTDPSVGAVGGRLRSHPMLRRVRLGWWRIAEHRLRSIEAVFESSIGCNSLLYGVRRELVDLLPRNSVSENFDLTFCASARRKVVIVQSAATAFMTDEPQGSEKKSLVYAVAGRILSLIRRPALLLPWHNALCWQMVSHDLLRILSPLAFAALFFGAMISADTNEKMMALLLIQSVFYAAGLLALAAPVLRFTLLGVPADLIRMNFFVLTGFAFAFQFLLRQQQLSKTR
jgi:hypothetical protein